MSTPIRQPWRLMDVTEPLSIYAPALAVTIIRRQPTHVDVLAGVRTGEANRTHADVVSVPTRRIPIVLAESWLTELDSGNDVGLTKNSDLVREVENLLARKLGVSDALELGQITLHIHAVGVWQGTSVIGEDEEGLLTEDLTMFNACVEIVEGTEQFPEQTASYRPIVWARTTDFLDMVRYRNVGALNAGLDEIMFCVYGLCLESAVRTLELVPDAVGEAPR